MWRIIDLGDPQPAGTSRRTKPLLPSSCVVGNPSLTGLWNGSPSSNRNPRAEPLVTGGGAENHSSRPLLYRRGRGQRHAMTAEDVYHFRAIGRASGGIGDYFSGFSEVRGAHYRRGYDGELFHILVAEIIEAVHRASGDAQRLPGTNLNGRAVNRPGKDALNTVEDLLVGVVLVGRRRSR
jgi:hypothetical protein